MRPESRILHLVCVRVRVQARSGCRKKLEPADRPVGYHAGLLARTSRADDTHRWSPAQARPTPMLHEAASSECSRRFCAWNSRAACRA